MPNKFKSMPTVQNVGIVGEGHFTPFQDGVITKEYKLWICMLERCFSQKYKSRNLEYRDVSVCEDWLHFQNFAVWCNAQIGFGSPGWHLDKDIIKPGNKIYSPETCAFVPGELNALLNKRKRARNASGVCGVLLTKYNRYYVNCKLGGTTIYGGTYLNKEDAFLKYKSIKEEYIKQQATKWQPQIDARVYEALMQYQVNMDD